jgi:hypothetical protein
VRRHPGRRNLPPAVRGRERIVWRRVVPASPTTAHFHLTAPLPHRPLSTSPPHVDWHLAPRAAPPPCRNSLRPQPPGTPRHCVPCCSSSAWGGHPHIPCTSPWAPTGFLRACPCCAPSMLLYRSCPCTRNVSMLWACPCTGLSMLWAPRSRSSSRTSPGPRCPSGGHENPHLPVPAQGATEKLAIFGPRRGRRGAELKVMAAVETKVRSGARSPAPPPRKSTHPHHPPPCLRPHAKLAAAHLRRRPPRSRRATSMTASRRRTRRRTGASRPSRSRCAA